MDNKWPGHREYAAEVINCPKAASSFPRIPLSRALRMTHGATSNSRSARSVTTTEGNIFLVFHEEEKLHRRGQSVMIGDAFKFKRGKRRIVSTKGGAAGFDPGNEEKLSSRLAQPARHSAWLLLSFRPFRCCILRLHSVHYRNVENFFLHSTHIGGILIKT